MRYYIYAEKRKGEFRCSVKSSDRNEAVYIAEGIYGRVRVFDMANSEIIFYK